MHKGILGARALLLATAASSLCGAAQAQQQASATANPTLEELVVTARRREENLQTVPTAVTALTGKGLQESSVATVKDLQTVTPSLTTTSTHSTNHVNFSLRGRAAENNSIGNEQVVEVYVADVRQIAPPLAQFYDVASVQVLRGPQGTLFGAASNGGAILFTPTPPGDTLDGYVSLQLGNLEDREIEGAITAPIIKDVLSVRLAGSVIRREGYAHILNLNNFDLEDRHSDAGRISVRFTPTSWFSNDLVYDHVWINQHTGAEFLLAAQPGRLSSNIHNPSNATFRTFLAQNPDLAALPNVAGGLQAYLATVRALGPYKQYVDQPENILIFKNRVDAVSNIARIDLGWMDVRYILGYQKERRQHSFIPDGTPFQIQGAFDSVISPQALLFDRHQWSHEFRFSGKLFEDRLDWLFGAYRQEVTDDLPGNTFWSMGSYSTNRVSFPVYFNKDSEALFLQGTFRVTDKLSVTAGGRRTWSETVQDQLSFSTQLNLRGWPSGVQVCTGTTIQATYTEPRCFSAHSELKARGDNWLLSADYKFNDQIFAYASATRGFRPGGFNATTSTPSLRAYSPEVIRQYEIGLKAEPRLGDVVARINVAAYLQDIKGSQVAYAVFNPARNATEGLTLNAESAKVKGFEVEGQFIFNRFFRLSVFGDYTDAKYGQFSLPVIAVDPTAPGGATVVSRRDVSGNPFPNTPEFHYGATAIVTLPVEERVGEVNLTLSYFRQAKSVFTTDIQNEPEAVIPDYGLWNAQARWSNVMGHPVDLTLFVKNLTDKFYIRGGLALQQQLGATYATPSEPRTYGVKLSYRFGASAAQ